jgi:RNA polymerase sigma-70 factor (ECF subfamily)
MAPICARPIAVERIVSDFWSEAVRRHDHTVVVALLAKGERLHDARELAQETWARLWAAHREGRLSEVALPGLAIRQAMFLLAERRRIQRRRPSVAVCEAEGLPAAAEPERLLGARQVLALVAEELGRATPRAREVLHASLADTPHAEHARQLGVSVQRFRQVLCAVRAKLRAAVEEATR